MSADGAISYRALDMLHARYGPRLRGREPFWRPTPAPVSAEVWEPRWTWRRPVTSGDGTRIGTLDANGAFLGAICTVEVAHGALAHTPRRSFHRAVPGLWLIDWHPWNYADRIVSPLGSRRDVERVWVTTPTMQLLENLCAEGVWPGLDVYDSWTCTDRCRLRAWGVHMRDDRARAMAHGDRPLVAAIKLGYSQAVTVMATSGAARVHRADWAQHIRGQHAASTWRKAWACINAGVRLGGMGAVDELSISWDDVERLRAAAAYGTPAPLTLDQTGVALGAWKVKEDTTTAAWAAAPGRRTARHQVGRRA